MDSILNSIKKMLGFDADYKAFDTDIIIHINTVFSIMHNLGATPPAGFFIEDETDTWPSFIEDRQNIHLIKTYMYFRVRLMFDPPTTSFAIEAMQKQVSEFEWRLNTLELVFNPAAYDRVVAVVDEDLTM